MEKEIRNLVKEIEPMIINFRRDFHKYPESGWTEFRTTALIAEKLLELGFEVKLGTDVIKKEDMMGVPGEKELRKHMLRAIEQGANPDLVKKMEGGLTGLVADLKCGEGPTIALRFDIDANDINEAQDEKHQPFREGFASVNPGVMHACGHDGHAAMGLGVAYLLARIKDNLKSNIRLIFQPGEEGARGAKAMIGKGVVDGVDYIIGGHIGFKADKTGRFICSTGKFLATTKLDVTFTGIPSHAGAAPHKGRNALLAAATAVVNLHAISRHGDGASRITVGTLNAGQGRNIIPPNAFMKMETRGETSEIDEYMAREAQKVIQGAALMYDVDYKIEQVGGTKSGESSPIMKEKIKKVALEMGIFDEIIDYVSFGATEDFSHFMSVVQKNGGIGTYFMLGSDLKAGHHDFYFDFDESVLSSGIELLVRTILELENEEK